MELDATSLLIHTLLRRDRLTDAEGGLIRAMKSRSKRFHRRQELVEMGSEPSTCCLIAEGLVARTVALSGGTRQICSIHVPGDFVDLHGLLLRVMDHSVVALSAGRAIFVPHEEVRKITRVSAHLTRMLWMLTAIDAAIQRAWIASLGRRSTVGHLAHLLCEIYLRLEAVKLAADSKFVLPLTQAELADVLGVSPVHANRSVQQLRGTGLITWARGTLHIRDFAALSALAEFDPVYLNLVQRAR